MMVTFLAIGALLVVDAALVVAVRIDAIRNPSRDWHAEVPAGDDR